MNRYRVEGIVRDLEQGKRVLLIGLRRTAARHVFLQVAQAMTDYDLQRVLVGDGRELIETGNGARLAVATANGARGLTADVVVFVGWESITDPDVLAGIVPALAATGGELIQT